MEILKLVTPKKIQRVVIIHVLMFFCITWCGKYDVAQCLAQTYHTLLFNQNTIDTVLFTPDDPVKQVLLGLIHSEQRSIWLAAYRVTDDDISQSLIAAHKRGVRLRIIIYKGAVDSPFEKISKLRAARIPIKVYSRGLYSIMHHKLFIFEKNIKNKSLVWCGSANATVGGMIRNQEYVHIIENKKTIGKFRQQFNKLEQLPSVTVLGR